ncbi:MAG TPA: hypothetical protein VIS77_09100, partial [Burkholderiales bacterium]
MATKKTIVKKAAVKKAPAKKAAPAVERRGARADRRGAGVDRHGVQHAVEQFLYAQAALLDNKRWQDWI